MSPEDIDKLIARYGSPKDAMKESVAPNAKPFVDNLRTLHKAYPELDFRTFFYVMMRALTQNAETLWASGWFNGKKRAGLKEVFLNNIDDLNIHLILQYLADNLPRETLHTWTSSPDEQLKRDISKLIVKYKKDPA